MSGEGRDLQSLWPQEEDVVPIGQATPGAALSARHIGTHYTPFSKRDENSQSGPKMRSSVPRKGRGRRPFSCAYLRLRDKWLR
jgi:hypothetical protein